MSQDETHEEEGKKKESNSLKRIFILDIITYPKGKQYFHSFTFSIFHSFCTVSFPLNLNNPFMEFEQTRRKKEEKLRQIPIQQRILYINTGKQQ